MKKGFIALILTFVFAIFMGNQASFIKAKEVVASERANKPNGDYLGIINLYNDHTIEFLYAYRVEKISIKICKKIECDLTDPQIKPERAYLDEQEAIFYLDDYLVKEEGKVTYQVIAYANFALDGNGGTSRAPVTLVAEIVVGEEKVDNTEKDYNESMERVKMVMNTWIIPIIYFVLAVTIVIKGILLSIDLMKYSDVPDLRKNKIKGFVYLALALLLVALINTGVAFITGLFNKA